MDFKNFPPLIFILNCIATVQGDAAYNTNNEICCNGTVVKKAKFLDCCGSVPYKYNEFLCCNGQLQPIPDDKISYECCTDNLGQVVAVYDYTSHQCCDGQIRKKPKPNGVYGCCEGQLFDYSFELCCNGTVLDRGHSKACCVDQVYNVLNQTCCDHWGSVNGKFVRLGYTIMDHNGPRTLCCGVGLYDPVSEACCNDTIIPKPKHADPSEVAHCCGMEPYSSDSVCCETWHWVNETKQIVRQLYHTNNSDISCCGLQVYDYEVEYCCNTTIHDMPKPVDTSVAYEEKCCGDLVIHNDEQEFCYNGRLYRRWNRDVWICGERFYDVNEQLCCNDVLIPLISGTDCCWNAKKGYNVTAEVCCDAKVVPLSIDDQRAGRNACCLVI